VSAFPQVIPAMEKNEECLTVQKKKKTEQKNKKKKQIG
jgi:hypothetical protein